VPSDSRLQLAEEQALLVRALVGGGPAPPGFEPARLRAASLALIAKRSRSVEKSWPALARELGPRFRPLFAAYAADHPKPAAGGALADGFLFSRLSAGPPSSDEARAERLAAEMRFKLRRNRAALRRGPAIRAAYLEQSRTILVAARLPLLGERWLSLPKRD
jgi:hypothetical protein